MAQLESADFQSFSNVTVAPAVEQLIGASVAAAVESPTVKCSVKVFTVLQLGTGTTSVVLKIYRGKDLTGVQIASAAYQPGVIAAGLYTSFGAAASDALSNAGQAQYCFSVTQMGTAANGSLAMAAIETMVLSG